MLLRLSVRVALLLLKRRSQFASVSKLTVAGRTNVGVVSKAKVKRSTALIRSMLIVRRSCQLVRHNNWLHASSY
jgi:uncharacterized protein YaiE (UPF0345 family)